MVQKWGAYHQNALKSEKSRILDEFVALTGTHRKHAIRVLRKDTPVVDLRTSCPGHKIYDEAVREALIIVWEVADRICGKRLKAILPQYVESMERHGHLVLESEVKKAVGRQSGHLGSIIETQAGEVLYRDRQGVRLLKTLCQTDPVKQLSWQTAAAVLDQRGIPREFTTTSRVAVIANRWQSLNADVAALEDRGHLIDFAPDALEVHRQAATWFWDQEIFDFVGAHLSLIEQPSFRIYHRAAELKLAGLAWKEAILSRCLKGKTLAVALLKMDPAYQTEAERVEAFIAAGHGCRASYFNHALKLSGGGPAPAIVLSTNVNPHEMPTTFDLLEFLNAVLGPIDGSALLVHVTLQGAVYLSVGRTEEIRR